MRPIKVLLRRARPSDCANLLKWRNNPATRRNSFQPKLIAASEHRKWFDSVLLSNSRFLLIAVKGNGQAFGTVRLDFISRQTYSIHVNLAPSARGKGLGTKVIRRAVLWAKKTLRAHRVCAEVKRENVSSVKAFEKAGFRLSRAANNPLEFVWRSQ